MFLSFSRRSYSILLGLLIASGLFAFPQKPSKQAAPAEKQTQPAAPKMTPEYEEYSKIWSGNTLDEKVNMALAFARKYPNSVEARNLSFVIFYEQKNAEKKATLPEIRTATEKFLNGTADCSAFLRSQYYADAAKRFDQRDLAPEEAIEFAKQGIALTNSGEYVAAEKQRHDTYAAHAKERDPKADEDPFSSAEAMEHYKGFAAGEYAVLGDLYFKSGQLDLAQKAYEDSNNIVTTAEASIGLSRISQKRALDYYVDAILTGKVDAAQVAKLHEMYVAAHPGATDADLQTYLDTAYRARYKNLLPEEPYQASDPGGRAVVAELVTGADCEPCTSVDISVDAALKRYPRNEFILLSYDWNAPTEDPLANFSVEDRVKYYDIHGAPTLILDGEIANVGEGTATEAPRVYANLEKAVEKDLASSAQAKINLAGNLENGVVHATVTVSGLPADPKDLRLQLALVSREISYSGRNGLRFHPMVMRNLGRPAGAEKPGFPLNSGNGDVEYDFNLAKISADNLKYYDWEVNDVKERTHGMVESSFREKRNEVWPHGLALVAFVQDDKTKAILQGTYVDVSDAPSTAATK